MRTSVTEAAKLNHLRSIPLCLLLLLAAELCLALDPGKQITQYANTVWNFASAANTIAGIELLRSIHKGQCALPLLLWKSTSAPVIWDAGLAS